MRSAEGNGSSVHEEEDKYEEDFSSKKEGTCNNKDTKNSDGANAIRSKHSVTEKRRRCKINERFQILRDLLPHGDHKRDTASFLLEVIEYVQLLQEKVHKYEGSCQAWSAEPTKLMPWRHNHWPVHGLLAQPQSIKNVVGPGMPFSGNSGEKSVSVNPNVIGNAQTQLEQGANQGAYRRLGESQSELAEKVPALCLPFQVQTPLSVRMDGVLAQSSQGITSDAQSIDCPITSEYQLDEHTIEGGTISISSTYSHELLTTLTQALQSSGVDLSKASISIRIDVGKRANQTLGSGLSHVKERGNASCNLATIHRDGIGGEELQQGQKRQKT